MSEPKAELLVWHYTTQSKLAAILDAGYLAPMAPPDVPERWAAVWFSLDQEWERTANKAVLDVATGKPRRLTRPEMLSLGAARVGVPASIVPRKWADYRRHAGLTPKQADGFLKRAMGASAGDWRVAFEAVPRGQWAAVEVYADGAWTPYTNQSLAVHASARLKRDGSYE